MAVAEERAEARGRLRRGVGRGDAHHVEALGAGLGQQEGFRLVGVQKSRSA
jgi:hypothetical protein